MTMGTHNAELPFLSNHLQIKKRKALSEQIHLNQIKYSCDVRGLYRSESQIHYIRVIREYSPRLMDYYVWFKMGCKSPGGF